MDGAWRWHVTVFRSSSTTRSPMPTAAAFPCCSSTGWAMRRIPGVTCCRRSRRSAASSPSICRALAAATSPTRPIPCRGTPASCSTCSTRSRSSVWRWPVIRWARSRRTGWRWSSRSASNAWPCSTADWRQSRASWTWGRCSSWRRASGSGSTHGYARIRRRPTTRCVLTTPTSMRCPRPTARCTMNGSINGSGMTTSAAPSSAPSAAWCAGCPASRRNCPPSWLRSPRRHTWCGANWIASPPWKTAARWPPCSPAPN